MRKTLLALCAAVTVFAAGALTTGTASAITLSSPAGIAAAIDDTSLAENVAYVCRRVRVCGPYGCGLPYRQVLPNVYQDERTIMPPECVRTESGR